MSTENGLPVAVPVGEAVAKDPVKAEEHKAIGNKLFSEHHFAKAVDEYTKAIEYDSTNPVYFSNRSICHVKLEAYGAAIEDATNALKLDENFVKAYYRRGAARIGLGRYRDALGDFKQLVKLTPNNKDALQKLQLCQTEVRRQAFEAAIESDNSKQASEYITYNDIIVEDSYEGPKLNDECVIDEQFIKDLIVHYRAQKKLHRRYMYQILLKTIALLKTLPTLVDVDIPESHHFTVCGDVHGQFYDVLNIFELNGLPSTTNPYLFNGDFVDRGSFSVEIMFLFFALKLLYPNHFHMTRGNHETINMNTSYGFQGEVLAKADVKAFSLFTEAFEWLPLALCLNKKVLCLHGGLFSKDGVTLDDIRKIKRNQQPPDEGIMTDLLWSDPQHSNGRSASKRGVGLSFGPDITKKFLDANGLSLLVRSHEVKEEGYEVEADGRLITIFSAPNYCDSMGNKGAFIKFGSDCIPKFTQFSAVQHPKVAPMAYASPMMRSAMMG